MNWPPEETEPAPDALLDRILASRAAGVRRILPSDHAAPSRLRVRMMRGAIAAVLGLVAVGMWAKWGRSHTPAPTANSAAGFGFPMGGDFGFGEMAMAQGAREPRFEPMTFDTARLHPVRLRYAAAQYMDGKLIGSDSSRIYSLARAANGDWILAAERVQGDSTSVTHHDRAEMSDSLWIDRSDLHDLVESWVEHASWVYGIGYLGGSRVRVRMTIGARSARMQTVDTSWLPTQTTGRGTRSGAADSAGPTRAPAPALQHNDASDTIVRMDTTVRLTDTILGLPVGRYPRLVSAYGGADLIFKLMAAPIVPGWKRSMVITRPGGTMVREGVRRASIPVDLELTGETQCKAPTVAVDCWRLFRRGSTAEMTYLVRKRDGVVTSMSVEGKADGKTFKSEMVLIGEQ